MLLQPFAGKSIDAREVQMRVVDAVAQWFKAAGFTHYVAKHQNSRYAPGTPAGSWRKNPVSSQTASGVENVR